MAYNKNYLFTHNVDWYTCIDGIWIYAASRGGLLPTIVDDESTLPQLQGICSNLPDVVQEKDVVINEKLIEERYQRAISIYRQRIGENQEYNNDYQEFMQAYTKEAFRTQFSALFVEKACKGFYSFIRVDIDDPYSNKYRLVACPASDSPAALSEVLICPFNEALTDKTYSNYIERISITSGRELMSFDFDLDFLF